MIVTVSAPVPSTLAIESIVIAPPEELTCKSTVSASSIVPVAKVIASVTVANSASMATSMVLPVAAVIVVAPSKLYKAPPKLRSSVASLPIFVIPITPGSSLSPPPGAPPIAALIVIFPSLSSLESVLSPALIFNPPNSLSTARPIVPLIVTSPVPDLIINTSLSP